MFHIKICGVTDMAGARLAAEAGADAIGLNFYPGSPRCIDVARAAEISEALPEVVARVGVFVNARAGEIAAAADRAGLDWIQLHGNEPPEFLAELPDSTAILRAFRFGDEGLAPLIAYLETCGQVGRTPDAVLIDAHAPHAYGGTGRTLPWPQLAREVSQLGGLPVVLAGGLNPGNVAEAIRTVRPAAVDVASGVELHPGSKDPRLVRSFVTAAAAAFAALQT